jgi:hypothetical protein
LPFPQPEVIPLHARVSTNFPAQYPEATSEKTVLQEGAKDAVTFLAALMAILHEGFVPHEAASAPQPLKTDPEKADAVRVTTLPAAKDATHKPPQSMPEGLLRIVPTPWP